MSVKTKCVKKTVNPAWDEHLVMGVQEEQIPNGHLEIVVMDKDSFGKDDCIGQVTLPLADIPQNTQTGKDFSLKLTGGQKKPQNGEVKIRLHFYNGAVQAGYKDQ